MTMTLRRGLTQTTWAFRKSDRGFVARSALPLSPLEGQAAVEPRTLRKGWTETTWGFDSKMSGQLLPDYPCYLFKAGRC
jgi:hypothetical protein